MSIIATNESKGSNYTIVPQGAHVARCYQMIELGTIKGEFQGEIKEHKKVRLSWELPNELKEFKQGEGEKPLVISKDFSLSMHEKANLRKSLEGWRGKSFTENEAKRFDVTVLLGKPCMINIIHTEKDSKIYANISSISALPKGFECPPQVNDNFLLSYDNFNFQQFETLPEFIKEKMKETPEFKNLMNLENNYISQSINENEGNQPF